MARTKHRAAKEHDRKWREKNKLKVKINNMDSYGKIVKKRVEDPDLHAKMKAAQTERTRLCRATPCLASPQPQVSYPRAGPPTREGLMGVGDRVASVIMLTLQRCPAPMLTQLV